MKTSLENNPEALLARVNKDIPQAGRGNEPGP
jgi:hypothetical protein